jgi:hypothetical protein
MRQLVMDAAIMHISRANPDWMACRADRSHTPFFGSFEFKYLENCDPGP